MAADRQSFNNELEQLLVRHRATTLVHRMWLLGSFLWDQAQTEGMGMGEFTIQLASSIKEKADRARDLYGRG